MPTFQQAFTAFRRWLARDWALRIISLLLAVGLWMFVNAGQKGSFTTLQVPVNYHSLPPGLVITNPHAAFVQIQVAGPRTLLSLLDPTRLGLKLDLTGVQPGQASFKILPGMFSLPRQTSVTRVSPSQITLAIDRVVTREVPVKPAVSGTVAAGYEISKVEAAPPKVEVSGPSHFVNALSALATRPLLVAGASGDVSGPLTLLPLGHHSRLAVHSVAAKAVVSEIIADKKFTDLQVQVRDTDRKTAVRPEHLNLTVRGPELKLASLDLTGQVFVEAKGMAPGWHEAPVQVNLPDGMTLVHQDPRKVRLRIYYQKRRSSS